MDGTANAADDYIAVEGILTFKAQVLMRGDDVIAVESYLLEGSI